MAASSPLHRSSGDGDVIQFPGVKERSDRSGSHPSSPTFQPQDVREHDHDGNTCTACDHHYFEHNDDTGGCTYEYFHPGASTHCRCPKFRP